MYTTSYKTAQSIGQIIEGEGIRVVDLSQDSDQKKETCEVVESNKDFSFTAKSLSKFFDCRLTVSNTEAYDIILKLGTVEDEWEVE